MSDPFPFRLRVLSTLSFDWQLDVSKNGGEAGIVQAGSRLTRRVIKSGGVGEDGPLVCTNWLSQSIAAVADVPDADTGNFEPAFRRIPGELLLWKLQPLLHSSNISATPATFGRYPPSSHPLMSSPPFDPVK